MRNRLYVVTGAGSREHSLGTQLISKLNYEHGVTPPALLTVARRGALENFRWLIGLEAWWEHLATPLKAVVSHPSFYHRTVGPIIDRWLEDQEERPTDYEPEVVLVNCAAQHHISPAVDQLYDYASDLFEANTLAPLRLAVLMQQHLGSLLVGVLNVASNAAWTPMTGNLAYAMSKAALVTGTRVLAKEWVKNDVQTTLWAVAPAKIADTGMSAMIDDVVAGGMQTTVEHAKAAQVRRMLAGQEIPAEELALFMAKQLVDIRRLRSLHGQILPYGEVMT